MKEKIEYHADMACSECDHIGAYKVGGAALCQTCLDRLIEEDVKDFEIVDGPAW